MQPYQNQSVRVVYVPVWYPPPRRAVTRGGYTIGWHIGQWILICATGFLYTPWYLRKVGKAGSRRRVTTWR